MLLLFGPTASGKSAVAMEIAQRRRAELICMDAMSVYRGMDVGTAKPAAAERARVPHHCLDVVDPWEHYDVGRWCRDAQAAREELAARGHVPGIVVGGTGLYLRACVEGMAPVPPGDEAIRERLLREGEDDGPDSLHRRLRAVDPASADRLHPNDLKRVVRALEVHIVSGRTMTDWHAETIPLMPDATVVVLERSDEDIRARIETRVDAMLQGDALLAEARALQARAAEAGKPIAAEPAQAVGYLEAFAHLAGAMDRATMRDEMLRRTWYLKRKQGTWAKSVAGARSLVVGPNEAVGEIADRVIAAAAAE